MFFDKLRVKALIFLGGDPYWLENIATINALQKKLKRLRKLNNVEKKPDYWNISEINGTLFKLSSIKKEIYHQEEFSYKNHFYVDYFHHRVRGDMKKVLMNELKNLEKNIGICAHYTYKRQWAIRISSN